MNRIVEIASKILRDPRVVLDRLYYFLTGIRVRELKNDCDNYRGTLSALGTLLGSYAPGTIETENILEAYDNISSDKDCRDLATLFAHYGSDKSTKHNYYLIYASILKGKRNLPVRILEIGLGTNNVDVPSNMGRDGKPGASLRAFRDWGPQCVVYGADVDKEILFSDERISTFFVDQTKPESLKKLSLQFPKSSFDLIIDDGLHNTWANLNTMNFALDLLKPGGSFVVEDINAESIPVWKMVLPRMGKDYRCQFIKEKAEFVCIIQKLVR